MTPTSSPPSRAHVLIAGGGFGAVETMLALRALAGERVEVTMVSGSPVLAYKPAATTESFEDVAPRKYDLRRIAADAGASFRQDRVEAVAAAAHQVRLSSFLHLDYDVLVLAVGARATSAIPGALTFRDQHETHHIRRLMRELRQEDLRRIVFAVPVGCSWPLPLYELALLTATTLEEAGIAGEVTLATPELMPLSVFGTQAARLVARVLGERKVRFMSGVAPQRVERNGALVLATGETVEADRVIAAPCLRAPRIAGLPADRWGFVRTDALGSVVGLPDVYAAGDMTSFPIKQGGLATQQADTIAQRIASELGIETMEPRVRRVLRARLVGGARPIYLRTELDEFGQPTASSLQAQFGEPQRGAPQEKVFGRYLSPYLNTREPEISTAKPRSATSPGPAPDTLVE